MILTDIGEIGVHFKGETHILRPSLYAMSQLGTPREIVQIYSIVMSDLQEPSIKWRQFKEALAVVNSCCEDDLSEVFGYVDDNLKYVDGIESKEKIVALAQSLLTHGITGTQEPLKRKDDDQSTYTAEFKASEHVSLAMAHLGMSEREAWDLTMTSLIGAMRSKYPEPESNEPGSKAPTKEQYDATMEWFDQIQRQRGQKLN
ncbi:glycoprotein [Vibrio phage NF]|uniref:Glycoprotein n=1 Tax=Vibrio phage NF TaxID=2686202 RepID=A0A6B9J584_9CAUD|nr:glycoprotein [Vibrio phage NF]QGZ13284.1 glycoprotein [Vibrio phage NF]